MILAASDKGDEMFSTYETMSLRCYINSGECNNNTGIDNIINNDVESNDKVSYFVLVQIVNQVSSL